MKTILKTIVGSQAHGLANTDSDFDYRGVFVVPTSEILKLHGSVSHTSWLEGKEDDTSWEIGKFLLMAVKSNPTVLETFLAPVVEFGEWSEKVRQIFPHVWNSNDVKNAFIGYGLNQRKKFFENKDGRQAKYACAYLRVLFNAWQILSMGTFSVCLLNTPVFDACKKFKLGNFEIGEVIQLTHEWQEKVEDAFADNPDKKSNLEPVNELLLEIRKQNW